MGLFSKLFHGFFYVVNQETLKKHLEKELVFSIENDLDSSANLNIYLNGEKHHIQVWNHSNSRNKEDRIKGFIVHYDKEEYSSIDDLFRIRLNQLPPYFKIELIYTDDPFLNEYKKAHPELKVQDYK